MDVLNHELTSYRYFDESNPRKSCPFGDDCFYKHEVNGKPYIFHYRAGDRAEVIYASLCQLRTALLTFIT